MFEQILPKIRNILNFNKVGPRGCADGRSKTTKVTAVFRNRFAKGSESGYSEMVKYVLRWDIPVVYDKYL